MKTVFLCFFVFLAAGYHFGQTVKPAKVQTVNIQTSAQCGDCKSRIEGGLNYTKGVKFAELDMTTKKVTIRFKAQMTNTEALKKIISAIGYDADEVKADPEAIKKLPLCCQPGGMD
jgi:mercuric ion binding protein